MTLESRSVVTRTPIELTSCTKEEVLQESYMMVPNSKGRLQESITKLQELVVRLLPLLLL